ncbi:glycosyltransferase family 4 protein [Idiomarina abyssalis]|uniref:glycosyltransferase family 4 protein n=1 Tax=Idiomarina abyssalis TaxID=86102 RepID=UPI003A91CD9F
MKKHVVHIITGLENGGAEGVLFRLCTNDTVYQHSVISLTSEGKFGLLLRQNEVRVITLDMKGMINSLMKLYNLHKALKTLSPDVVQTWMYHADLLGGIIAKLSGVKNINWNVRHSNLSRAHNSLSTILVAKSCAWLSRFIPNSIVCCAEQARITHEALGYDSRKTVVIPNGYDFSERDKTNSISIKKELSLAKSTPLIGMVARYNPQKNHAALLRAFSLIEHDDAHLVLVGPNITEANEELVTLIRSLNISKRVHLLGERTDIPSLMSELDLHVLSSSSGEGFPNVVAEAMASGTPCVVTDVGDASFIVGNLGWVVEPGNEYALSEAIQMALSQKESRPAQWNQRKIDSAQSVRQRFSIEKMILAYHKVWEKS